MAEESKLEQKFVRTMEKAGWKALKLVCPGFNGMPDRIVLKNDGKVFFAELKAPGEKPEALQKARHASLRSRGFRVYVVDSEEMIYSVWRSEHDLSAA